MRAVIDRYLDEAAQGVSIINRDVAPGCIVFAEGRELVQKPAKRRIYQGLLPALYIFQTGWRLDHHNSIGATQFLIKEYSYAEFYRFNVKRHCRGLFSLNKYFCRRSCS
ncbi:hypothetical protein [Pseudomonas sp. NFR16]|uniref:hypothetical protein n=1 Tax=Pseudomonas sp. NFR16 TaxID=1566248 RepID=UPI001160592A|nr:hypothetical protein [Pseudomonas sp. NFR16]